ncbi:13750_t:CDS:10, partial [Acaulospora morrowiae]
HFISIFVNIWKTSNSKQDKKFEDEEKDRHPKDLSIAVRGVGYFAAPAKRIMDENRLQQLFHDLLKPTTWAVLSANETETLANVSQIPLFIEAYCYIGKEFDVIFDELMETIEREVITMLTYYPRLTHDLRLRSANVFEQLLLVLYEKGPGILQKFISKIFYQALILTCSDTIQSQKHSSDQNRNAQNFIDIIADHTYQEMFDFWDHIFKESTLSWANRQNGHSSINFENGENAKEFFSILYDEFFLAVFRMIRTLNFKVVDVSTNDTTSTITSETEKNYENIDSNLVAIAGSGDLENLQPIVSKDFVIYQNLVDFWQLFLPRIKPRLFSRWVYLSGDNLISFSIQYPYVSGFYKMLESCLRVCEDIQFFNGIKKPDNECTAESDLCNQLLSSATIIQRASYFLYTKFLKEVCARLSQYKDDLLASCLRFVLSVPKELLHIDDLISPICIVLKLGKNHQPLANIGLDAIEKIIDLKGPRDLSKWLGQILPFFNEYLLVKSDMMDNSLKEIAQFRENAQKNRRALKSVEKARKQKIREAGLIKSAKTIVGVGQLERNVGLHDLQVRILRILGRLGGLSKSIFEDIVNDDLAHVSSSPSKSPGIKNKSSKSNNILAWDPERRLSFVIPYPDSRINILFDEFLPRIVELAESAPDRKTKVVACELLHSIMLFMIGKSALKVRSTKGPQESPFSKTYRRIFPALLRLAIDSDQVPRKLFQRLVSQMIHWFTNNAQYENPETIALLQCCLDAICDSWSSLRDYGAECLNEFLLWSIKQSSEHQLEENPMNMKSLFKRLYDFSAHPDYAKRLGASLAVNHIYRVFREEEYLVNQFTFELLYWMLFNLRLSELDQDATGTRQQAIAAVRHLKKIINVKHQLFLKETKNRRTFHGLNRADLSSLVGWLFVETSRRESDYASMCRELFVEFIKLLPDFRNGSRWIMDKVSRQPLFLSDLYKTSALSSFDQERSRNQHHTKEWCGRFLSVLENYTWLIREKFVTPEVLMRNETSNFLEAINYFLDKMVLVADLRPILDVMEIDHHQSSSVVVDPEKIMTPAERSRWINLRAKMINRFIDFVIAHLEVSVDNDFDVWGAAIYNVLFFKTLARCLFYSEKLMPDGNTYKDFSKKLCTLLRLIKHIGGPQLNQCFREIADVAFSADVDLLNIEFDKSDPTHYISMAFGFRILSTTGTLHDLFHFTSSDMIHHSTIYSYISALWRKIVSLRDVKDPLWIELLDNLLALVLINNFDTLNTWLLQDLLGFPSNQSMLGYQDGCMYYQKFSTSINNHLSRNFAEYASIFCENINDPIIKDVLLNIVDYLIYKKDPEQTTKFLNDFASSTSFLSQFVKAYSRDQRFLLRLWRVLVKLDLDLLKRPLLVEFKKIFHKLYVSFLRRETDLIFKSEACDLLPVFLRSDMPKDEIEMCITEMLNYQFPLLSSEYSLKGPKMLNEYITVLDKLLTTMVQSNSVNLFKILVPTFVRETDHIYSDQFQRQLGKFVSQLPRTKFEEMTDIAFGYFRDSNFANFHRNIIHSILTPVLMQGSKIFVVDFYKKHIKELVDIIERENRTRTEQERVYELDAKAEEDIYSEKGEIVKAYCQGRQVKSKELTRKVMEISHKIKSRGEKGEFMSKEIQEALFLLRCAAYNALAAAIIRTQSSQQFFKTFLFAGNPANGELIWENIVDLETKVSFKVDLEQPFFNVRIDDFRTKSDASFQDVNKSSSLKYLASQYLSDSSITQNTDLLEVDENSRDDEPMDLEMEASELSQENSNSREFEVDIINLNPCMKMIIKAIERLHSSITPPPTELADSMPGWMNEMHKKFTRKETHINIKLFLAKIIINYPEAFEKYASFWIRPLMNLVIEGDSYGEGINYFIQDLCVVITVWGSLIKLQSYEDKVLIYELLNFLMRNVCHKNRAVFRNNLQTIKGIFEIWHEFIVIPTRVIYDYINSSEENKILAGLQLLGIVLAHEKKPFQQEVGIDLGDLTDEKFYRNLAKKLSHTKYTIRDLCAEVCGMALKHLRKYHCSDGRITVLLDPTQEMVATLYQKVMNKQADANAFLTCVHHIAMHDPQVSEKFLRYVFNLLPRLNAVNDKKFLALELISYCAETEPDLLTNLKKPQLLNLLKHRNENEQLIALRILNGVLKQQGDSELVDYFLETLIESFHDHPNIECRKSFYAILIQLYNSISDESLKDKKVKQKLKSGLLRGLADVNESIQQTLTEFWHGQQELSRDTFTRLKFLVGNLYSPEIETLFLHYACYLLLEGSKKSIDYNKPIFDQPLPHSKFGDTYDDIDTSWRFNSTMNPLFVNTQQINAKIRSEQKNDREVLIRATDDNLDFPLTMDPSNIEFGSQSGNWSLTQSNLLFSSTNTRGKRKKMHENQPRSTQVSQYQSLRKRAFSSST